MTAHHGHDHAAGHRHPQQPDIEDRPFEHYQVMAEAVGELLIEKGVLSAEELRRDGQTVMFVAIDGQAVGLLGVADPIKKSTPRRFRLCTKKECGS